MFGIQEQPPISVPQTDTCEPRRNDVLCGRGVATNRHEGNVQYRSLVALNKVRADGDSPHQA